MISLGARFVKSAIRLFTFKYRRKQASVTRNVRIKPRPYKCPEDLNYTEEYYNGVKVQILSPEKPSRNKIILHFHGGGGAIGMDGLFYRRVAEKYARISNTKVYSIDYRAGKEVVQPSFLDECFLAYKGLLDSGLKGEDIVAVGDSKGWLCLKRRYPYVPVPTARQAESHTEKTVIKTLCTLCRFI